MIEMAWCEAIVSVGCVRCREDNRTMQVEINLPAGSVADWQVPAAALRDDFELTVRRSSPEGAAQ